MGLVELEDMPHGLIRLGSITPAMSAHARDQVGLVEAAGRVRRAVRVLDRDHGRERAGRGVSVRAGDVETCRWRPR